MKTRALGWAVGFLTLAVLASLKASGREENTMIGVNGGYEESELRGRLTPEQYRVTRLNGTEPPFHNEYWNNHEAGIYVDVVSGEPLFSSADKFDSGTGWPSFTKPLLRENVVEKSDRGLWMKRTEVRSRGGDSHLGHVFDDGPAPSGKRYCINSAALRFIPTAKLKAEGYGTYAVEAAKTEKAVFAAGCFWHVEASFSAISGVTATRVGYTGGAARRPSYEQVGSGATGHAEAVEVEFDPARISYGELLKKFWKLHDPTTLDRQGPDEGAQYRSAVFTHGARQLEEARRSMAAEQASGRHSGRIVTQIAPAAEFWPAEEYHQKYYAKKGGNRMCPVPNVRGGA